MSNQPQPIRSSALDEFLEDEKVVLALQLFFDDQITEIELTGRIASRKFAVIENRLNRPIDEDPDALRKAKREGAA